MCACASRAVLSLAGEVLLATCKQCAASRWTFLMVRDMAALDLAFASVPLLVHEAACRGRFSSVLLSLRMRKLPRAKATSNSKRDVPLNDMARATLRVCQSTSPPTLQTLARQRTVTESGRTS